MVLEDVIFARLGDTVLADAYAALRGPAPARLAHKEEVCYTSRGKGKSRNQVFLGRKLREDVARRG